MKIRMDSRLRGFTLIELMITMAIVAILTAIAYPNYRNYVLRGQVVDATNALSVLRANLERSYQDTRTYTCPATAKVGSFSVACTADTTGQSYSATATGSGSTNGFVYSIDQNGTQSTTITGVKGWSTTCKTAWITKAGQTC